MHKEKNIVVALLILTVSVSLGLLLFSFTQVDLGLTLSQQSLFQRIQKGFQYIGFYQRPLATAIYSALLLTLAGIYVSCFVFAKKKRLTEKDVWLFVGAFVVILFFSYPAAFSYDIYNYIFTAKTVLLYETNPYIVRPLDFQGIDPMLSFMRWTHLPSAYTPVWIGLTLIPYLAGLGSLLLTIWTMKIVPLLFYLLSIWSIGSIMKKINPSQKTVAMVLFALNPLVIIEVLVSAHNDIVMMGLALLAYQVYLQKRTFLSFLLLSTSVAVKFITIFLFPVFISRWSPGKSLVLLSIALFLVLLRREFLAWYMLWIIPFAALVPENKSLSSIVTGISLGLLSKYIPVFYYGNFDSPVPFIQNILLIFILSLSVLFLLGNQIRKKFKNI